MQLTEQQNKEYFLVSQFVEKSSKTWFMDNYQKWNCAITSNSLDVNEMSTVSGDQAKTSLKNRLFGSDFHRKWIVNSWAKGIS